MKKTSSPSRVPPITFEWAEVKITTTTGVYTTHPLNGFLVRIIRPAASDPDCYVVETDRNCKELFSGSWANWDRNEHFSSPQQTLIYWRVLQPGFLAACKAALL